MSVRWRSAILQFARRLWIARPEAVSEARARDLLALVRSRLPLTVPSAILTEPWPLYGPALVARMAGTLEAVLTLRSLKREADALSLLRVLYEHAATFAWLAAEPSVRVPLFRKNDAEQRLKAENDGRQFGIEPISLGTRVQLVALRDTVAGCMPNVPARAIEADAYWSTVIPECSRPKDPLSLRGLYAVVYRLGSAFVHPTEIGLHRVVTGQAPASCVVHLEGPPKRGGPLGLAGTLFGLVLFIAAESFGWPTRDDVTAVFDRYDPTPDA